MAVGRRLVVASVLVASIAATPYATPMQVVIGTVRHAERATPPVFALMTPRGEYYHLAVSSFGAAERLSEMVDSQVVITGVITTTTRRVAQEVRGVIEITTVTPLRQSIAPIIRARHAKPTRHPHNTPGR